MIKGFSELKKGDRVLLVHRGFSNRVATCMECPSLEPNLSLMRLRIFLAHPKDVLRITRDRNFQIPVFAQSNI
jgi:hypothetical protein